MKNSTRAALEVWKFVVYLTVPVGLVWWIYRPENVKKGLLKVGGA